jgi:hypothetical protein
MHTHVVRIGHIHYIHAYIKVCDSYLHAYNPCARMFSHNTQHILTASQEPCASIHCLYSAHAHIHACHMRAYFLLTRTSAHIHAWKALALTQHHDAYARTDLSKGILCANSVTKGSMTTTHCGHIFAGSTSRATCARTSATSPMNSTPTSVFLSCFDGTMSMLQDQCFSDEIHTHLRCSTVT